MKAENRLSSTTTLTVNVMDSDDQDPAFEHDTYNAKVSRGMGPNKPYRKNRGISTVGNHKKTVGFFRL
jgi:hypothetical protein